MRPGPEEENKRKLQGILRQDKTAEVSVALWLSTLFETRREMANLGMTRSADKKIEFRIASCTWQKFLQLA